MQSRVDNVEQGNRVKSRAYGVEGRGQIPESSSREQRVRVKNLQYKEDIEQ